MKHSMLLLTLALMVGNASAADVTVVPSSKTVTQGQTFNLNVSIDPLGTAIAGAQVNIAFNKSILNVNSITEGNLFKQNGASTFFSNGTINNSLGTVVNIFDAILGPTNVSTPGTFIIINATAIGSSGTSGINLSNVIISDPNATAVALSVTNGSITINSPPVLAVIGNKKAYEGQTLSFVLSATDANGDALTYAASNLPSGAAFNPATQTFQWTPGFTQSGTYPDVHFEVSDGISADSENITITVNNQTDVIVIPSSKIVTPGQTFNLNISIDPSGTAITGAQLNIEFNGSVLNVNSITEGNLLKQNGAITFFNKGTINNSLGTVVNIFDAILGPTNVFTPGTFIIINVTAVGSSGKSVINLSDVMISDPDGNAVALNVTSGSITINTPPVLAAIGNKKAYEGQTLTFVLSATDANGDALTYSASNLPGGAAFNPATQIFQWTPGFTQSGTYPDIHFEVSDGALTDFENITITVNNQTDVIVSPSSKNVTQGQTFNLNVSIDPLGTAINGAQLNIEFNKSILNINSITEGNLLKQNGASTFFNSGTINNSLGTVVNIFNAIIGPTNVSTPGTFIIINVTAVGSSGKSVINLSDVEISDPDGNAVALNVSNGSITINAPPVLAAIGNKTVDENQTLTFTLSALDANGDALTYSASNLPSSATFNPLTRTFQWTPGFTQSGTYTNVHFEVSDGILTDFENITITVNNVNSPPTFTATPANGSIFNETDPIQINVTASDPENDPLGYIIKIDGVQVSSASGYTWTTNYTSSGSHNINISVSDGMVTVTTTITIYINNIYPRYDVDENGIVDIADLTVIGQHFNQIVSPPYPRYDVNMDGVVNIADIVIAAQHFGEST